MKSCKCKKCDCDNEKVRVSFCPNCKSRDVRFVFELRNLFGVVPKMKCLKCKTELPSFPVLEIKKGELVKKKDSSKKSKAKPRSKKK